MMDFNIQKLLLEELVFKGEIVGQKKGRGGLIYIVERDAYPKRVAYKTVQEFESFLSSSSSDLSRIDREAKHWFSFSGHPFIITPFYMEKYQGFPLICMPYCDGDLSDLVQDSIEFICLISIFLQLLRGVMSAEEKGMHNHQDLKPENVLYIDLSKKHKDVDFYATKPYVKYQVKLADFGVANAWVDNNYTGGTNIYKAPEQHDKEAFNIFNADIFSIGLIMAELYQGYHPAAKDSSQKINNWRGSKVKKWALSSERNLKEPTSEEAICFVMLVKKMLNADPMLRPSIQDCYDTVEGIFKKYYPDDFKSFRLLLDYYEYVDSYMSFQKRISKMLTVASIPSEFESVKTKLKDEIDTLISKDFFDKNEVVNFYHLMKAFFSLCEDGLSHDDNSTLTDGSKKILDFMSQKYSEIESFNLNPVFDFNKDSTFKIGSDFEARSQIIIFCFETLENLNALNQYYRHLFNSLDIFKYSLEMSRAHEKWVGGHHKDAFNILNCFYSEIPYEKEFEELYCLWKKTSELDIYSNLGMS